MTGGPQELRELTLASTRLVATFVPAAGMIGVSLREGDAELLGQRRGLAAYVRDGKTMGLPLLHPWANRLSGNSYVVEGRTVELPEGSPVVRRDANGLPIHGLLAGCPHWRLEEPSSDRTKADSSLSATLDFGARLELMEAFPFPHRLRIDIALHAATLRVTTTLTPSGDLGVPVAFGFHPYLQLSAVPRESWRVELPAMSRLEADERGIPTGQESPQAATAVALGKTAYDDGFADVEPGSTFAVSDQARRITVTLDDGYPAAQVFAPLTEEVICFEPMTAPTNALVSGDRLQIVAPGDVYVATFAITVTDAPDAGERPRR